MASRNNQICQTRLKEVSVTNSNYISIKANWKYMESTIAFGLKFVPSVGSIKLLFGQDAVSASVFTILNESI